MKSSDRAMPRRSLAKGLAWSVPTVVVASAIPADAASNPTATLQSGSMCVVSTGNGKDFHLILDFAVTGNVTVTIDSLTITNMTSLGVTLPASYNLTTSNTQIIIPFSKSNANCAGSLDMHYTTNTGQNVTVSSLTLTCAPNC